MAACGACGGSGTVKVEITSTQTGRTQVLTQTCLSCMGTGKAGR